MAAQQWLPQNPNTHLVPGVGDRGGGNSPGLGAAERVGAKRAAKRLRPCPFDTLLTVSCADGCAEREAVATCIDSGFVDVAATGWACCRVGTQPAKQARAF
jgi:hypothetical protein